MLEPGRRYGRFLIEERLARGGMAVVYKVEDLEHLQTRAIKVLREEMAEDPSLRARFTREAEILTTLCHRNILPVFGEAEVDGLPCIVMHFVPDGDLHRLLEHTLDAATVLALFRQACAGVHKANQSHIYHRDLKPANLLVERRSEGLHLYVADFSVAIGEDRHATRYTAHGFPVGSNGYKSPEQLRGEVAGAPGDIYALGCCLRSMVGVHNCVGAVQRVVERATAPLAIERPRDAIALYEEAAEALGPLGRKPLPPSPPRDPEATRADTASTGALPPTRGQAPVVDRALAAVGLVGLGTDSCVVRSRSRPQEVVAVLGTAEPVLVQAARKELTTWLTAELGVARVELVVLADGEDLSWTVRAYLTDRFGEQALPRDFQAVDASLRGDLLEIQLTPRLDRLCDEAALAPLAAFLGIRQVALQPTESRRAA